MCGIVGGIAQRDVAAILLEGLRRLEYRGYDSAGMAIIDHEHHLHCNRTVGKVEKLAELLNIHPLPGKLGIAHTRWATHGIPHERNAHPIMSHETIAIVHNGIIENFEEIRRELIVLGYHFHSETDSETVAHLLHYLLSSDMSYIAALRELMRRLSGAYALGIVFSAMPDRLFAVRSGSPLVIGLGIGENFIASDQLALLPVTQRFIFMQEGDIAEIGTDHLQIYDHQGELVERAPLKTEINIESVERGQYRHFMAKEIFEQPSAICLTVREHMPVRDDFTIGLHELLKPIINAVKRVHIVACGTSFHAGQVGRYWFEEIARIPCQVEVASELRSRQSVIEPGTLLVCISQSGETADTLAVLRENKNAGYLATLGICNVAESTLSREVDFVLLTKAGIEIGVASTKAFTTQLVVLLQLVVTLGLANGLTKERAALIVEELYVLPNQIEKVLMLDESIKYLAERFSEKRHTLFLGRGVNYPIALEGALKLKEISYIHAEGYPAGELKHGPLALVDHEMPVVVVAPHDQLLEKLKSNLQEIKARGGELIVFTQTSSGIQETEGLSVVHLPITATVTAPICYVVPLQLLAYYVALLKGTDVDQPRNLAKSVTVE